MILERYENLIKKLIKSYGLSFEFDEMLQVGRIALWEAYEKFNPSKGYFPSYAKKYVAGRILQAAKKHLPHESEVEMSDSILHTTHTYEELYLEEMYIEEYVKNLSRRERLFVDCVILQGETQTELAQREGVSYETVRSWKKAALTKLRIKASKLNHPIGY